MSETVTTAYSELTRVLPWSLRGLGYSFPVADRAAHVIASAAAITPGVLDDISRMSSRTGSLACIDIHDEKTFSVDAKGQSFIEVGPAMLDFMGAHAPADGFLKGTIKDITDLEILPAVLLIGGDYDLGCLAVASSGKGLYWCIQMASNGKRGIVQGADLPSLERVLAGGAKEMLDAARQCVESDVATATCVIFATHSIFVLPQVNDADVIDADAMLLDAHRRGIPIKPGTLKAIYDLEKRTWAPTSERSRAQAGFQKSSGAVT
ncbi:hypothetical protein [Phyllobacterium sp. SB3]|uniref:hypothetical protein n=1 Tax=Phyllobacterium sp. SB3 TaxID=3156073 RepID=UPI0032B01A2A